MSDISSVGQGSVGPVNRIATFSAHVENRSENPHLTPNGTGNDRVELSQHARLLDELRRLPDVRLDRIEAARQAIADGAYETPERLDAAIDRLLDDLGG